MTRSARFQFDGIIGIRRLTEPGQFEITIDRPLQPVLDCGHGFLAAKYRSMKLDAGIEIGFTVVPDPQSLRFEIKFIDQARFRSPYVRKYEAPLTSMMQPVANSVPADARDTSASYYNWCFHLFPNECLIMGNHDTNTKKVKI